MRLTSVLTGFSVLKQFFLMLTITIFNFTKIKHFFDIS
jgi:hypothetical protein